MKLKHGETCLPPQNSSVRICAVAISPNDEKIAAATGDRYIYLFDRSGEKKDKIPTKSSDPKTGKNYLITALEFSPDSISIAVAQTDSIVYVYRIGRIWGEKKSITNKFIQPSPVTCIKWLREDLLIITLFNGNVRQANVKMNKCVGLFSTDSPVISLCASPNKKAIITGHMDGSIARYFFAQDKLFFGSQGKIATHTCPPYALVWGSASFVASGGDMKVLCYNKDGKSFQYFDYAQDPSEKSFNCAVASPQGNVMVLGSYNRLRVYTWANKKCKWEETTKIDIENLYSITSMAYSNDGTMIVIGTLCGSVEIFYCCLKKKLYHNRYEMNYSSGSQVTVRDIETKSIFVISSSRGSEIETIKIFENHGVVLAGTSDTLIFYDIPTSRKTEIVWQGSLDHIKFKFDTVYIIYWEGQLSVVEMGSTEILYSVRTSFYNPNVISVRLRPGTTKKSDPDKVMAYLIDRNTIGIVNLETGVAKAEIYHSQKIDWLELSESCEYLMYREKSLKLFLYSNIAKQSNLLLDNCTYAQWIPESDIACAQSQHIFYVWYKITMLNEATQIEVKGDVIGVEKNKGVAEILVNSGSSTNRIPMDNKIVEFNSAIDSGNFLKAVHFLETFEKNLETDFMWNDLAELALDCGNISIAKRCFAALGDIAKLNYLEKISKFSEGKSDHVFKAEIELLRKNISKAENIYYEQNDIDGIIDMYLKLQQWEDAIFVTRMRDQSKHNQLSEDYFRWLINSGQEKKAAQIKESNGDYKEAVELYLTSGSPSSAAKTVSSHYNLINDQILVDRIKNTLIRAQLYEQAGELLESSSNLEEAYQCYKKWNIFPKAIEIAKKKYPGEILMLEENFADYLVEEKEFDSALNHYIEAGKTVKALETAMRGQNWNVAVQILDNMSHQGDEKYMAYYDKIATHYEESGNLKNAEEIYLKMKLPRKAIEMYTKHQRLGDAQILVKNYLSREEGESFLLEQATELSNTVKLREAEKLFVSSGNPDKAISMYMKHKLYDDMIRLIKQYHPEHVNEAYLQLGKEHENSGNFRGAEKFYLNGKNWKNVVAMYRKTLSWEDAIRVSKEHGTTEVVNRLVYEWAHTLASDVAVKLLLKYGLVKFAIHDAVNKKDFKFAISVAEQTKYEELNQVYIQYAIHLEDDGNFDEAEKYFIAAKNPHEAVLMHINNKAWKAANRVAQTHSHSSLKEIALAQGKDAFLNGQYQQAESMFLSIDEPSVLLELYKDYSMWDEVMRIARKYTPEKVADLLKQLENNKVSTEDGTFNNLIQQARSYEVSNDYKKAIEHYLIAVNQPKIDSELLEKCCNKIFDLSVRRFDPEKSKKIVQEICQILINNGLYLRAAEKLLQIDMIKESIDILIDGGEWKKARKVASQLDPRYQPYVEKKYKEFLKQKGSNFELSQIDTNESIQIHVEKNEWDIVFKMAAVEGRDSLNKYLGMRAIQLLKIEDYAQIVTIFNEHKPPANPQLYQIYRKVHFELISSYFLSISEDSEAQNNSYGLLSKLRNIFFLLCETTGISSTVKKEFETLMMIAHYYSAACAMSVFTQLRENVAKISLSLLRYIHSIPADKAFIEAAFCCKAVDWNSIAFVMANRFFDIDEAIHDGSQESLRLVELDETDIPVEDLLLTDRPSNQFGGKVNELRQWLIGSAFNTMASAGLPLGNHEIFEGSLGLRNDQPLYQPSILTGYPVRDPKVSFKHPYSANKDEWNCFLMAIKTTNDSRLVDVLTFLEKLAHATEEIVF